ncbi:hypothetical protein SNEBB_011044, partial [Seison nebaliae]
MYFAHRLEKNFIPPERLYYPKHLLSDKELDEFRNPFVAMAEIDIWPIPFVDHHFVGSDINVELTLAEAKVLGEYQSTTKRIYEKYLVEEPPVPILNRSVTNFPKIYLDSALEERNVPIDKIIKTFYHKRGTPESPTIEDINLISYKRLLHVGITIMLTKGYYILKSVANIVKLMKFRNYSPDWAFYENYRNAEAFYKKMDITRKNCLKQLFTGTEESLRMRHNRSPGYFSEEELDYVHNEFIDYWGEKCPPMLSCAKEFMQAYQAYLEIVETIYIPTMKNDWPKLRGDHFYKKFDFDLMKQSEDVEKDKAYEKDIMVYQNILDSMDGDIFVWYSFLNDLGPASSVGYHTNNNKRKSRLKAILGDLTLTLYQNDRNRQLLMSKFNTLMAVLQSDSNKRVEKIHRNDESHPTPRIILHFGNTNNKELLMYNENLRTPSLMVLTCWLQIMEASNFYYASLYLFSVQQIYQSHQITEKLEEQNTIHKFLNRISVIQYNALLMYSPYMVAMINTVGFDQNVNRLIISLIKEPIALAIEIFENPSQHTLPIDRTENFTFPILVPPGKQLVSLPQVGKILKSKSVNLSYLQPLGSTKPTLDNFDRFEIELGKTEYEDDSDDDTDESSSYESSSYESSSDSEYRYFSKPRKPPIPKELKLVWELEPKDKGNKTIEKNVEEHSNENDREYTKEEDSEQSKEPRSYITDDLSKYYVIDKEPKPNPVILEYTTGQFERPLSYDMDDPSKDYMDKWRRQNPTIVESSRESESEGDERECKSEGEESECDSEGKSWNDAIIFPGINSIDNIYVLPILSATDVIKPSGDHSVRIESYLKEQPEPAGDYSLPLQWPSKISTEPQSSTRPMKVPVPRLMDQVPRREFVDHPPPRIHNPPPPMGYPQPPRNYLRPPQGYPQPPVRYPQPPVRYPQPPVRYPQPPPGYQQPPPGYPQPPPRYPQPTSRYQQPPPGYRQPPPGYQQPPLGYQQPPLIVHDDGPPQFPDLSNYNFKMGVWKPQPQNNEVENKEPKKELRKVNNGADERPIDTNGIRLISKNPPPKPNPKDVFEQGSADDWIEPSRQPLRNDLSSSNSITDEPENFIGLEFINSKFVEEVKVEKQRQFPEMNMEERSVKMVDNMEIDITFIHIGIGFFN